MRDRPAPHLGEKEGPYGGRGQDAGVISTVEPALMRGLDTAFPFFRLGLSLV